MAPLQTKRVSGQACDASKLSPVTENAQQQPSAPATDLPTQYAPADVEGTLYERWVERGYFAADAKSDKPAYTIVIPRRTSPAACTSGTPSSTPSWTP